MLVSSVSGQVAEDEIWKACRSYHHCIYLVSKHMGGSLRVLLSSVFHQAQILLRAGGQGVHLFRGCFFLAQRSSAKVCMTPAMLLVKGHVR